MAARSERVSPTAYATGYFWYRHGLSHPGLATPEGQRLDRMFRLLIGGTRATSGVSLSAMMLARHLGIDARLTAAIDAGRVSQVIELASGLSARGWRFSKKYGERITYIETDLPNMVATKRRLLDEAGLARPNHRVEMLDALAANGERSLSAIAATLDPQRGLAIITEGLMSYLAPVSAEGVWRRIAATLQRFPHGHYLSDLYLRKGNISASMIAFRAFLQAFVRGRMYVHFHSAEEAETRLRALGFADVTLHQTRDLEATRTYARTPGGERVRVLEACVTR
jgi:O-methyltransferase involved in polyketide biosynthesis